MIPNTRTPFFCAAITGPGASLQKVAHPDINKDAAVAEALANPRRPNGQGPGTHLSTLKDEEAHGAERD